MWRWLVLFHQQPINVDKMGRPIWGPGQPIRRLIQRRFHPSCARRLYFLCKSTDFHDMRTECKIIKTYHSFLTVLKISHKFPEIDQLLAPWSLPDHSPISPQSLLGLLKLCCQNYDFPQRLKTWTLLQRYHFLIPFPIQWMNLLTEYPPGWHCSPNPPNVLPTLQSTERPHCPHTTSQIQNGRNYHFHFDLLSIDDPPAPHYENLPKCFNQVKNFDDGRTLAFLLSILSNTPVADLENLNKEVHLRHIKHLLS